MMVTCLDPYCAKYKIIDYVDNRRKFFEHVVKKPDERIIEVLKQYHVITTPEILSKYTLINIFIDCCKVENAKLLEQRRIELE